MLLTGLDAPLWREVDGLSETLDGTRKVSIGLTSVGNSHQHACGKRRFQR
jgi:hypothetical protein